MVELNSENLQEAFIRWHGNVNSFADGMAKLQDKWKRPSPHVCLQFAAEEAGEAIGAWITYNNPDKFARNNPDSKHPHYQQELAQCLMMLLKSIESVRSDITTNAKEILERYDLLTHKEDALENAFHFVGIALIHANDVPVPSYTTDTALWIMAILWSELEDLMGFTLDNVVRKHVAGKVVAVPENDGRIFNGTWKRLARYGNEDYGHDAESHAFFLEDLGLYFEKAVLSLEYTDDVKAYQEAWPNHCPDCGGWGGHELYGGEEYDFEPCECVLSKCPRCEAPKNDGGGEDEIMVFPCYACGWNFDRGIPLL